MNGPIKLYSMKQIVPQDLPVELPVCMYRLKNVQSAIDSSKSTKDDIAEQNDPVLPEMTALMARQQEILKQLEELRFQMVEIKNNLSSSSEKSLQTVAANDAFFVDHRRVVIVNANPTKPPYSLQFIQKYWSDNDFRLVVTSHVHSTVTDLCPEAKTLTNALVNYRPEKLTTRATLNVTLIWTNNVGRNSQLVTSSSTVLGEVNFLRYFANIGPVSLRYESLPNFYEYDDVLDASQALIMAKNKTQRKYLLARMFKKLGKSKWFCGANGIGVADVAAFSAIKHVAESEINQTMGKWMERCKDVIET